MHAALVLGHAAATLYMTGLIWFVQLVHYPLFARVGELGFAEYQSQHMARTGWAVGPPMLLEAATAGLLLLARPDYVRPWMTWSGAALLAVVWLSTALLQVPQHETLTRGFDPGAHALLVGTNWVRTVAWTARSLLCLWMIHGALAGAVQG